MALTGLMQLFRGTLANLSVLPTTGLQGVLAWTTDSNELFVDLGSGAPGIGSGRAWQRVGSGNQFFNVANPSELTGLVAAVGAIAESASDGATYILTAFPPTVLGNWRAISTSFTPGEAVDARTTDVESISDGDRGGLITFNHSSPVAVSLAQAGSAGRFPAGWYCDITNFGAGVVTITPATSTIDGQTPLVLQQYQGVRLVSDGSNYFTVRGIPEFGQLAPGLVLVGPDLVSASVDRISTGTNSDLVNVSISATPSRVGDWAIYTATPGGGYGFHNDINAGWSLFSGLSFQTYMSLYQQPLSTTAPVTATQTIIPSPGGPTDTIHWSWTAILLLLSGQPTIYQSAQTNLLIGSTGGPFSQQHVFTGSGGPPHNLAAGHDLLVFFNINLNIATRGAVGSITDTQGLTYERVAEIFTPGADADHNGTLTAVWRAKNTLAGPNTISFVINTDHSWYTPIAFITTMEVSHIADIFGLPTFRRLTANDMPPGFQGVTLKTDGTVNSDQTLLNLKAGTGITLSASGGDVTIAGSATPFYQTIQQAGSSKTQRDKLNFLSPTTATDNAGNDSTDIAIPAFVGDGGSGGTIGLVPAPASGDAAANKVLKADGSWASLSGIFQLLSGKDAASGYAGLDAGVMLKPAEQATAVDARTTTSEAIADSDRAKLVTFSNTGAIAATIAQAGASSSFLAGWYCDLVNLNTGVVTLTPATSTIDGALTLVLQRYQGVRLVSDGANYSTIRGLVVNAAPTDGDVLTYVGANKDWENKPLSALGGANASQIRGKNIDSTAPADREFLVYDNAATQYDLKLPERYIASADPGFVSVRDDFMSGLSSRIGELDWTSFGTFGTTISNTNCTPFGSWGPYHIGTFGWSNNGTSDTAEGIVLCNNLSGSTGLIGDYMWPLFDYPGWEMNFVFSMRRNSISLTSGAGQAQGVATPFPLARKALYVGLQGRGGNQSAGLVGPPSRPTYFVGVRFDTSTTAPSINDSHFILEAVENFMITTQTRGGAGAQVNTQGGITGSITNIDVTSNVLTVTAANTFVVGQPVAFSAMTTATYLNGKTVIVATRSATQFTANFIHANNGSHADTGTASAGGGTHDTLITPAESIWYRLNIKCTTRGQAILTFTGGGSTSSATFTLIKYDSTSLSGGTIIGGNGLIQVAIAGFPPYAPGGLLTVSNVTTDSGNANGTDMVIDSGPGSALSSVCYVPINPTTANNTNFQLEMAAYPAFLPFFQFGNDDNGSPLANTIFLVDFFSFSYNPRLYDVSTAEGTNRSRFLTGT